ncbi:MAG: 2,3,4,5-tetrahydropyridine-2,6-dicarboxylate N-acetyltransferase [Candidatus Aminicenantes bacterium]|nr:2,3,4,5-tetrahydropyridine-2,6-dicarboxylate N-acetyltransferase [Candidatus Aminicenantes bacterium]
MQKAGQDFRVLADLISRSKKTTPCRIYLQGTFTDGDFTGVHFQTFGTGDFRILIGDYAEIKPWLAGRKKRVRSIYSEIAARHSALPMLDLRKVNARIEPGAIIRDGAKIGRDCVIMMGAVINIGAEIGARSMIDMNAVCGARAIVGKNCHIGAGAVLAGVLEPPGRVPVVIEDNVLVGANAVVLEGVRVGRGSVVAAGAVVISDIPAGVVAAGSPARVIKKTADVDPSKIAIVGKLRRR